MEPARLSHTPPPSGTVGVNQAMFQQQIEKLAKETIKSLDQIWSQCGYEDVECQGLRGDILSKIRNICNQEVEAEQKILDHAKEQVEAQKARLASLYKQLGRAAPNHVAQAESNYADKLTALEKAILAITEEVDRRQDLMTEAFREIEVLAEELEEKLPEESEFNLPPNDPELSDLRLNAYRTHTQKLKKFKDARIEEMRSIALDCYKSIQDLVLESEGYASTEERSKYKAMDDCIIECAKNDRFTFRLGKRDLADLTARFQSLYEEKERRREELAKSGTDIARLWTLLRITAAEREEFTSSFQMNLSMHTVLAGRKELNRLMEIRVKSLGKVIGSIRAEIEALWRELALDGEEQRREEFEAFYYPVESLQDSSVEEHEAYCLSLKARVEELRPLLAKITRREMIVQERVELEHIMCNPERLKARGPDARQERKREEEMIARVNKLEKLTKEITAAVATWEEQNGPLKYGSSRYVDLVKRQEESYIELRDSLRNSRKKKDAKPEPTYITAPKIPPQKKLMSSTLPTAMGSSGGLGSPSKLHATTPLAEQENRPDARQSNGSNGSVETDFTAATAIKDKSRIV